MRRWAGLWVAAAVAMPGAVDAADAESNPHLEAALGHIERGQLDEARTALGQAMKWPKNSNPILVEIYRNLAVVYFYAGEEGKAYEAFARVLNIDLKYELPERTAAPLVELFERVRRAYRDGLLKPLRVAHDPPLHVLPETPVSLTATISNMQSGFEARVHYRSPGEPAFASLPLAERPGARYIAGLPPVSLRAGEQGRLIEYYIEVTDSEGRRVQGRGSALSPLSYLVESPAAPAPPPRPRWYKNPWVWTAVGVVALGTTGAVLYATQGPKSGTLPVTVRVNQ